MNTKVSSKNAAVKLRTLHKNKLPPKKREDSSYSTIFASAVGGGTLGAAFGVPGVIVGAAIGGGIGVFMKHAHA